MITMSYLIRPTSAFQDSYLAALREGMNGPQSEEEIAVIASDFDVHLTKLDKDGQTPHEEFGRTLASVPSLTPWYGDRYCAAQLYGK
jgi:hypothetical protein